jgi:hypothetical protein
MFAHISSNFWRKITVNAGRLKWVLTLALEGARRAGVAVAVPRSAESAHQGQSLVRWSMRCSRDRYATALLAQSARAARPHRAAQSVAAPPYPTPCHRRMRTAPPLGGHWPSWWTREPPLQLAPVYKGTSLFFLARYRAAVATLTAAGELDLPRVFCANQLSQDLHSDPL